MGPLTDTEWLINGGSYAELLAVLEEKGQMPEGANEDLDPAAVLKEDSIKRLTTVFLDAFEEGEDGASWYSRVGGSRQGAEALAEAIRGVVQ